MPSGIKSAPNSAPMPDWVVGIDFSGGVDAGRKIWIAQARAKGEILAIEAVTSAADLPGGSRKREDALPALVRSLRTLGNGIGGVAAGMDFPFGVHRSLVPDSSLRGFVAAFLGRYPTSQAFREACNAQGSERNLKRACDREARTPFAPHNLRLYRQTWHGIAQVLAPLCADGACLLPMEAPEPGRLWLLETCPASTLKRLGRSMGYKGRSPDHLRSRLDLLTWLEQERGLLLPESARDIVLNDTEGDALDSVLCAWVTWRTLQDPAQLSPPLEDAHRVEGWVYF